MLPKSCSVFRLALVAVVWQLTVGVSQAQSSARSSLLDSCGFSWLPDRIYQSTEYPDTFYFAQDETSTFALPVIGGVTTIDCWLLQIPVADFVVSTGLSTACDNSTSNSQGSGSSRDDSNSGSSSDNTRSGGSSSGGAGTLVGRRLQAGFIRQAPAETSSQQLHTMHTGIHGAMVSHRMLQQSSESAGSTGSESASGSAAGSGTGSSGSGPTESGFKIGFHTTPSSGAPSQAPPTDEGAFGSFRNTPPTSPFTSSTSIQFPPNNCTSDTLQELANSLAGGTYYESVDYFDIWYRLLQSSIDDAYYGCIISFSDCFGACLNLDDFFATVDVTFDDICAAAGLS